MQIRELDTTGTWQVNGEPIYIPDAEVSITHSHIASSDSGRDESGYMHIIWLRTDVYKVGIRYALMTGSELNYIRSRMQGREFSFTFVDEGTKKTIRGYCGEVTATLYTKLNGVNIYKDVAANVIEL